MNKTFAQYINENNILKQGELLFKFELDNGTYFNTVKRDTKGMPGTQDKFKMYVTDKKGKVIKDWGSHPSLEGSKKFMKNNLKELTESVNEKLDPEDYKAEVEKSKDGYRPKVTNIARKAASYLGVSYKTEKIALEIAQGYLDIMTTSTSERRLDDFVWKYRKDLVK